MAYTALYRKWRPQTFSEVQGQEAVVQTLRNQLKSDRIGHAYLFCGTRGTGKTSIAKLFARAVNCEHPREDGSPCNECPTCKAILAGSSMNVAEIDAASNNGVDSIREIREDVRYSPTNGKYRVYIIDEVHMLSTGAYNALLKTLEEPPSYVIFILATTEAAKIPVTVLSRCQRYDFKRIPMNVILEHLKHLTKEEGIDAEEKALRYVARSADGAMRDALSILEQCISYYYGQKLTYENVLEVVGAVDTAVFCELMDAILLKDVDKGMNIIRDMVYSGRDLSQFVSDFIWFLRNLMFIQTSSVTEEELGMSKENFEQHESMALRVDLDDLMRYIRIFSELQNRLRYAVEKRTLFEVCVIQAMRPQMETDLSGVLARIRSLEDWKDQGNFVIGPKTETSSGSLEEPGKNSGEETAPIQKNDTEKQVVELGQADYDDLTEIKKKYSDICSKCGGLLKKFFLETYVQVRGENEFLVVFRDDFQYNTVLRKDYIKVFDAAAEKVLKKSFHFTPVLEHMINPDVVYKKKQEESDIESKIGMKMGEEE